MLPGTPRFFIGSTTFTVRGLSDERSECTVIEHIATVAGVESVTVDLHTGVVNVRAAVPVDRADLAAAIAKAGFVLIP